jgi:hypothetical protein
MYCLRKQKERVPLVVMHERQPHRQGMSWEAKCDHGKGWISLTPLEGWLSVVLGLSGFLAKWHVGFYLY